MTTRYEIICDFSCVSGWDFDTLCENIADGHYDDNVGYRDIEAAMQWILENQDNAQRVLEAIAERTCK